MTTPSRVERDVEVLERELAERAAESERLRELVHAMAEAPDTNTLLQVLADRAVVLCSAEAATVSRVDSGTVEILAATETVAAFVGAAFPIRGTITEQVVRDRVTVASTDYRMHSAHRVTEPAMRHIPQRFVVGPLILTPLIMSKEVMGVLCIMRGAGGDPFSARDEQQATVLADYAAMALKKSRLFEVAQAANQAKSAFLATMSHELRTPLTALTGYGELLADGVLGPLLPAQHDAVERMRTVTHHLSVMIDAILTFSNLEAGREQVTVTDVVPATVMRAVQAVIEPLAHKKPAMTFEVRLDASIARFRSDEDKIRQILVNLVGNAVKFTETGTVRVSVVEQAGEIRFSVADTGIGIPEEELARLFQPFMQVDGSLTRRYGGTGLGLYISNRLATLIGARIEVHSVSGVGSTFTLVVPR